MSDDSRAISPGPEKQRAKGQHAKRCATHCRTQPRSQAASDGSDRPSSKTIQGNMSSIRFMSDAMPPPQRRAMGVYAGPSLKKPKQNSQSLSKTYVSFSFFLFLSLSFSFFLSGNNRCGSSRCSAARTWRYGWEQSISALLPPQQFQTR
jgi:hypothetical protein